MFAAIPRTLLERQPEPKDEGTSLSDYARSAMGYRLYSIAALASETEHDARTPAVPVLSSCYLLFLNTLSKDINMLYVIHFHSCATRVPFCRRRSAGLSSIGIGWRPIGGETGTSAPGRTLRLGIRANPGPQCSP
jgi:hypothetical protein